MLVVVIDDKTAGGESTKLLDDGLVVGVLEVRPQVVRRPKAYKEPVRVAFCPTAKILADGEVHNVRDALP